MASMVNNAMEGMSLNSDADADDEDAKVAFADVNCGKVENKNKNKSPPTRDNGGQQERPALWANAVDISGASGGVLKLVKEPAPAEAFKCSSGATCIVHYVGYLEVGGGVFDSSRRSGYPFKFTVGMGQVCKGFDLAVLSMQVGEKAMFRLLSDYAYGVHGMGEDIPGGATLVFDVELISCEGGVDSASAKAEQEYNVYVQEQREEKKRAAAQAKKDKEAKKAAEKAAKKAKKKAKKLKEEESKKKMMAKLSSIEIKKMKPKQLKEVMKLRGLSTQGNKKELLTRLMDHEAAR